MTPLSPSGHWSCTLDHRDGAGNPIPCPDMLTVSEPDRDSRRLRALRSQRRSAIPRGCLWWSTWCVVGAGIWVAGIAVVWRVVG